VSTRITVVTPSYNQAQFLEETLRSVLCQRDQIHEYFVIDGGSTDGSSEIIRKYQRCIDFWTSEKDAGQADAIQKGFSRATGDVLCWLNSDDVFLPGALQRVREAFDRHPQWDVLTGYHVRIDEDTNIVSMHRSAGESRFKARCGISRVCQQTCFFRRDLYQRVGGIKLDLHCVLDTELWMRMFDAGAHWGHIPEYLAGYRWHSQAKMIGTTWADKAEAERQWLRAAYARYSDARPRTKLSVPLYRMSQIVTGRYLRAQREGARWKGKKLTSIFGDWTVTGCSSSAVATGAG
jgi:glycosyltransferase involved in cell wall biosynthesis